MVPFLMTWNLGRPRTTRARESRWTYWQPAGARWQQCISNLWGCAHRSDWRRSMTTHRATPQIQALESRRLYNAAGWADAVDNPFLPFTPGMIWVYKGVKNGVAERNRVVVQSYTRTLMGVTCTVVLDRVYEAGKLTEKTHDY